MILPGIYTMYILSVIRVVSSSSVTIIANGAEISSTNHELSITDEDNYDFDDSDDPLIIESEFFNPELWDIKKPRSKINTNNATADGIDYTKRLKIEALGRKFNVKLKLFDDFISPDMVVEYTDLEKPDKGKSVSGEKLLRGCVFNGKAVDSNKTLRDNKTYQAIFNLCHGIRGGIISGDYEYSIKPNTKMSEGPPSPKTITKQHSTAAKKYCISKKIIKKHVPSTVGKPVKPLSPKDVSIDEPKKNVFEIEFALFVKLNGKKSPNVNEIASVVAMTARTLQNPSIGATFRLILTRIVYITGDHGIQLFGGVYTLESFKKYLEKYSRAFPAIKWDVAGLFSSEISPPGGPSGVAFTGSVCESEQSCLISEYYGLGSAATLTHEIGHSLGAPHDYGHDASGGEVCLNFKDKRRGIMGYDLEPDERYRWSQCSRAYILKYLKEPSARKCLLTRQAKVDPKVKTTPDKKFNCREFCASMFSSPECFYNESNCTIVYCKPGGTTDTFDGLYCSGNKLTPKPSGFECLQGKCVKAKA